MKSGKVLVVCLNPTFELTVVLDSFYENEVNRTANYFTLPSGKGVNVARVLTQLGTEAHVLTHLGGSRADEFLDLCKAENIILESFPSTSPVRTCINIVNGEKKTSTEIVQEPLAVEKGAGKRAFDLFDSLIGQFDALVITGTRAQGYEADLYPRMTGRAKELGKLVVLDLKGEDLRRSLLSRPDVIKPNLSELVATVEKGRVVFENENSDALRETVRAVTKKIFDDYGTKSVISRGKFDTWVYDGNEFFALPNKDVPVVNTIGCGDALTAGMTHRLLSGDALKDAVSFGMECALKNAQSLRHGLQ